MRRWWAGVVVVAACGSSPPRAGSSEVSGGSSAAPPPPGCVRQRVSHHFHCSGMDRGDSNTYPVTVCDGCATNADCTARPGGTCASTGGAMCSAPAAFVCRYPNDVCDGCEYCSNDERGAAVCQKRPSAPPAMESRPEPPLEELRLGPKPKTNASLRLDGLQLGDRIDGARVTDIAREPYLGAATWDLRPVGGSTDGVLLGTTLAR